MSVNQETLLHVARLARLSIEPSALAKREHEVNALLGVLDELSAINTEDVQPLFHPGDIALHLRADKAQAAGESARAAFQAIAPEVSGDMYLVPKVIESKGEA
jgi:aspartyl-tRNA(Asn)/glutamyl-tRNA(Gln) amidotransferase subunit C